MTASYLSMDAARAAYAQASAETGVSVDDMLSETRRKAVVRGRWRVMQIMREQGASTLMIGMRMGLHHTTIINALNGGRAR